MTERLIIVGGGQAAAQAIQSLRQHDFAGGITLIGEEPFLPYQRPPLSKKYLAGELPRERLFLRPAAFYSDRQVELELGARVAEIDVVRHVVVLTDGRKRDYDTLLLATGSRPRRLELPGANLGGVHYLRSIADVDAISAALTPTAHVVLIGAGYIGLEVAAVLRQHGLRITVLEGSDRVMSRVVCPAVSTYYHRKHTEAGVEIRYGVNVRGFNGAERVRSVDVAGTSLMCDLVIVGVGVVPNTELASAAGLRCDNGIVVDEFAQTADASVFAAGDCTNLPHPALGRRVRLESVQNAVHQAKVAGAGICGTRSAYSEVPWFWSDQYDVKLQIAGLSQGYEEVVIRGDPNADSFAAYYLAGGHLMAVDAVNSPRDFMQAKKLIAAGVRITADELRDPSKDINALAV
jgi:3-phenylpropionate/trans-cinnamate dioxygenase ferredoxin reductase component